MSKMQQENLFGLKKRKIPEDFKVTPAMIEWAAANKLPDPRSEVDQFMDYHRAKGDSMLDWAAAFRTWMRNCRKWAKDVPVLQAPKRRIPPKPETTERHDPKVAAMLSDLVRQFDVRTGK